MSQNQPKSRNPRVTARERGLIKGSLRRAFARSDLHNQVLESYSVEHCDPKRPRCRKWCYCAQCGVVFPRWQAAVDHLEPLVPVDRTFEEMSLDEVVDRLWCAPECLQVLDPDCHSRKSAAENKIRRENKKLRKATK